MKSVLFEELLNQIRNSDPNLTRLVLRDYNFTDKEMKLVAEALQTNHSIGFCDFGFQLFAPGSISDEVFKNLCESLTFNNTVKTLRFSYSVIGDQKAEFIKNLLKDNTSIRDLYFMSCSIGDIGLKHLGEGLKYNRRVETLDLYNNPCLSGCHLMTYFCSSFSARATP